MKLFYDDEFDAIATAIGDSGKPFKLVAGHLFPDMKPESAYAQPDTPADGLASSASLRQVRG